MEPGAKVALAFFLVPLLALFSIFTPFLVSAYLPDFRCYRKRKGGIWYQVCPKYIPGCCEYWTQTLPEFTYYINNVEDYTVTETYPQDYRK